ncbi:uncharacterized protein LOC141664571 [Apium graveolens]|uniref:uncharacterized protein LOC141664571 n=1 Tax=Apium graveolens TaxID=4045 RepID=UPI003D7BDE55
MSRDLLPASLESLQDHLQVNKGVLTLVPNDTNVEATEIVIPNATVGNSWRNIVTKNVPSTSTQNCDNARIMFNEDVPATLKPPTNFLKYARKSWDSSLIGHFIGGSFDFKFVREQGFKMWKNKGLSKFFYSSKGYFTFKFTTVEEKDEILRLHSVQMGGKTLYLVPWMEGNQFKRNVIHTVPCWIKLVDIPHSYWSREGLSFIAKAVGVPLKFDDNTSRFEPMKFAQVQVQLSLCKAFGHSLSRCANNPDAVRPAPRARNRSGVGTQPRTNGPKMDPPSNGVTIEPQTDKRCAETAQLVGDKGFETPLVDDINPTIIGELAGCDVVLDDDQHGDDIQINEPKQVNHVLEDDLENFDARPTVQAPPLDTIEHEAQDEDTEALPRYMELIAEGLIVDLSTSGRKRTRSKSTTTTVEETPVHKEVAIGLGVSTPKPNIPKPHSKAITDEDGFTLVVNRKSPKLGGGGNQLFFADLDEVLLMEFCISKKINRAWKWLFNYDYHYNGLVWVGWNPDIWDITLHSSSAQHITCNAHFIEKDIHFLVTFVYAFNDGADRHALWSHLSSLGTCLMLWCVLGDFNCILSLNEVSGGREHWTPEMQSFKDCVVQVGLRHVRTVRDLFTWYNKRPNDPIHKRLDRMLANGLWFSQFTEGNAFIKNRGIMDHNPILFHELMQIKKLGKPFQFFNYMLELPNFLSTVQSAWQVVLFGNLMVVLARKIKLTKNALKELNKNHGDINDNVTSARASLRVVQDKLVLHKDCDLLAFEKSLSEKLAQCLLQQEHFLLQKARVKWMHKGDGNNIFFFNQCKKIGILVKF